MTDAPKPGPRRNCISDESAAPKPGPPEADGSPAMLRAMAPDLKPFHRAVVMAAASAYDKLAEERTSLRKAVDRLETDNAQLRAALGTAVATTEEWHVEYTRECADSESLRAQLAAVTKELDDCRAVLEGT